jgi:hypothetical protein
VGAGEGAAVKVRAGLLRAGAAPNTVLQVVEAPCPYAGRSRAVMLRQPAVSGWRLGG